MVTAALGLAEQQDDGARAPGLPRLCGPLTGGGDSSALLKLPAGISGNANSTVQSLDPWGLPHPLPQPGFSDILAPVDFAQTRRWGEFFLCGQILFFSYLSYFILKLLSCV